MRRFESSRGHFNLFLHLPEFRLQQVLSSMSLPHRFDPTVTPTQVISDGIWWTIWTARPSQWQALASGRAATLECPVLEEADFAEVRRKAGDTGRFEQPAR